MNTGIGAIVIIPSSVKASAELVIFVASRSSRNLRHWIKIRTPLAHASNTITKIGRINAISYAKLVEITNAGGSHSFFLGRSQNGQQHRRKDSNDGNNYQQLNERKSMNVFSGFLVHKLKYACFIRSQIHNFADSSNRSGGYFSTFNPLAINVQSDVHTT